MQKTVYGLSTCDNTRAALKWLRANSISPVFHDFATHGITTGKLSEWLQQVPVEKLLNKKSTTWRSLSPAQQEMASSEDGAVQLMIQFSNLVKRPVIELNGRVESVGVIHGADKK